MTTAAERALQRVAQALGDLDSIPAQASAEAAREIERLIQDQFRSGTDPSGRPWKDLASGGRSFLFRSGDLFGSIHVKPRPGAGVRVTVDAKYASYHQTGTKRMPARKILPEDELPESWELAIERAVENSMRRKFQGTGVRVRR